MNLTLCKYFAFSTLHPRFAFMSGTGLLVPFLFQSLLLSPSFHQMEELHYSKFVYSLVFYRVYSSWDDGCFHQSIFSMRNFQRMLYSVQSLYFISVNAVRTLAKQSLYHLLGTTLLIFSYSWVIFHSVYMWYITISWSFNHFLELINCFQLSTNMYISEKCKIFFTEMKEQEKEFPLSMLIPYSLITHKWIR